MDSNSDPLMPGEDDSANIFFKEVQRFKSRWNVLNEQYKNLEASLREAKIEKEQLQANLALSRDYIQKIEKEKEKLANVVQELRRNLQQNSVLHWIKTLGNNIYKLNESALKIINDNDLRVIDEISLLSSDDESKMLTNNNEKTSERHQKESCTIQSRPNSTFHFTDHNYSLENSATLDRNTASVGSEDSVEDTMMSIENSSLRDSNEDLSFNDTSVFCSDEISLVKVPTLLQNSSLIVPLVENDDESCAAIEKRTIDGNLIPENEQTLSENSTLSINEKLLSTEKEQYLDVSYDFTVDAQSSSKPLPKQISLENGEIFPRNKIIILSKDKVYEIQSITSLENLSPLYMGKSEVPFTSSQTASRTKVEESESTTNGCEKSETSANTPDSPQLICIADVVTCTKEKESTDSANNFIPSLPLLIEYSSESIPVTNNETLVENYNEITNSSQDARINMQQTAKSFHSHFLNSRNEILEKNCIDFHVSVSNQQHVRFSNKALLEQEVNHNDNEVHPADKIASKKSELKLLDTFEITNYENKMINGKKSTTCEITNKSDALHNSEKLMYQKGTPEELMCRIFGTPNTSPKNDSDVIRVRNEPNLANGLNLSNRKPMVQPELTVNLPRMDIRAFKMIKESINTVTCYSTNEAKNTSSSQTKPLNSKRPCSPSSVLEPEAKRLSLRKSIEFNSNLVWREKKEMNCLFCKSGEKFDCYSALDAHITAEHPNPYPIYFRCHYGRGKCQRHFRTIKQVNDHVKRRHFEDDLSLPIEKLYPEQKPWKCSICDKIFAHSSHLSEHLRHSHNVTETEGIAKYEFKMHGRAVERRTISKFSKNGSFVGTCVICLNDKKSSEKFRSYRDLDDHISRNHSNPYPFYLKCPFCENKNIRHFKGLSWLNKHLQNHHSSIF